MSNLVRKIIPMLDRVLVQRAEAITTTKAGIIIPEKAQSKVLEGTVIAVGPGFINKEGRQISLRVKVGDTVLLPEFGGTKVQLDDKREYHIFREADILAKVQ